MTRVIKAMFGALWNTALGVFAAIAVLAVLGLIYYVYIVWGSAGPVVTAYWPWLVGIAVIVLLYWLLRSRKPKEKKIGHAHDRQVSRNRAGRWFFFILSIAVTQLALGAVINLTAYPLVDFEGDTVFFFILGGLIGADILARIISSYIVSVPQVQGFVTLNTLLPTFGLNGEPNVIYGPGYHISYPWEQRSEKSNFSLEVFTIDFKEEVPGRETQLEATGSYQGKPALERASHFIGIDEATIRSGAIDLIKAEVSQQLSNKGGDEAKEEIQALNTILHQVFVAGKNKTPTDPHIKEQIDLVVDFEAEYGLTSVKAILSGIDFPAAVQEARNARDKVGQIFRGVAAMLGIEPGELKELRKNGMITNEYYLQLVERFQASSGTATMDLKVIRGLDMKELGLGLAGLKGVTK